jgi:hypothetical protein
MVGLAPEAIGPSVSHRANHRGSSNLQSTAFASHYRLKKIDFTSTQAKKMPNFLNRESGTFDWKRLCLPPVSALNDQPWQN